MGFSYSSFFNFPYVISKHYFHLPSFMMGLAFNSFFTIPYTLGEPFLPHEHTHNKNISLSLSCLFAAIEYVEESKRTLVGNIGLALALTVSGVYQPWLVKALGDWKVFNWLLFAQMALVIATPLIMPESCRYLLKSLCRDALRAFQVANVHGRGGKDCEDYEEDCKDERQRGSYQTE